MNNELTNIKLLKKIKYEYPVKLGERVCCIASITNEKIVSFGCGIYIGLCIPHTKIFSIGWTSKYYPTILLDNGNLVYGVECLWGNENFVFNIVEEMVESYNTKLFVIDDIEKYRVEDYIIKYQQLKLIFSIPNESLMLKLLRKIYFYE